MAEELVRGTRRTLPSADCCKLYSYGEYWFPSGSRRCCRMTHSSVIMPPLFFTSEYIQVRALLPMEGFFAMLQVTSLKSAASRSMQSELLLHAAQGLLTLAEKYEFINQKMGGGEQNKIKMNSFFVMLQVRSLKSAASSPNFHFMLPMDT